jgi:hypothetical protein
LHGLVHPHIRNAPGVSASDVGLALVRPLWTVFERMAQTSRESACPAFAVTGL